ncbi:MAG: hypothetical protein HQL54_13515 [Magnetococcales bacterium]|nr:hypothetical protein [Magnetococcales bacterium]
MINFLQTASLFGVPNALQRRSAKRTARRDILTDDGEELTARHVENMSSGTVVRSIENRVNTPSSVHGHAPCRIGAAFQSEIEAVEALLAESDHQPLVRIQKRQTASNETLEHLKAIIQREMARTISNNPTHALKPELRKKLLMAALRRFSAGY